MHPAVVAVTTASSTSMTAERSRGGLADVDVVLAYRHLGLLDQLLTRLLSLESDETEALSLVLRLVEGHLELYDVAEFGEEGLDIIVRHLGLEASNKDFPRLGLGLLDVDLFAVDCVFYPGREELVHCGRVLKDDESEAPRLSRDGVRLEVDGLDRTELFEIFL